MSDPAETPSANAPSNDDATSQKQVRAPASEATSSSGPDLTAIAADLDGVEAALARLDAGTYWSDEVTGAPLPDELLARDPVARRAPG